MRVIMEETPDIGVSTNNGRLVEREDDNCCNILGVLVVHASSFKNDGYLLSDFHAW